jgi:hypothetical protein
MNLRRSELSSVEAIAAIRGGCRGPKLDASERTYTEIVALNRTLLDL